MAEITSALDRRTVITRPTLYSASRWEAAHEIRAGERQDAPPAILLCMVLRADRGELRARAGNASLLLRSQVLRRSLQGGRPSAAAAREGVMTITGASNRPPQP